MIGEEIPVEERAVVEWSWAMALAISLASRSYAEARLGHIGRGTLKGSIQRNRPRCNNARCATLATTRRQIVCTLWYIVCGRAFKTVSHELRFASSTKAIAREPWLVGSQHLVCSKHSYTYIKLSFFKNKMFNGTVSLKCHIFNRNNFRMI